MSNLRTLRFTASTAFDGTTPITTEYKPANDPKQPLSAVEQANIGRISFAEMLRPGTLNGLFRIRSWGDLSASASLVSPSSAELAELPPANVPATNPLGVNTVLETIQLGSAWSGPYQAGASDALTLTGDRGTVELVLLDASGEDLLRFWSGLAARPEVPPSQLLVLTGSATLPTWSGDLYVVWEPADPGETLTLPPVGALAEPARLHLARVGGSWGVLQIDPGFGGGSINGGSAIVIGEAKETLVEFIDEQFIATTPPRVSDVNLTNAVAGTTVDVPVIFGTSVYNVNFSAYGNLKLPAVAAVPVGATYIFPRTGDSTATPPVPAQVKVVVQTAGDLMDGVADDVRYLGSVGSLLVIRRDAGGWVTWGNRQDVADQTVVVTGTSYTFASGWVGTKYVRSTNAGATTVTAPPSARTPIGCRIVYVCEGAGDGTFASNANILAGGVSAASVAVNQYEFGAFEFNGTNWVAT